MTFFAALRLYGRAHHILRQPAFRRFLWLPGVISLIYMVLLVVVGQRYIESGVAYIGEAWMPEFMQGAVVGIFLNVLLWLLMLVGILLTYRPVVLTILAPLLGTLSERVEQAVRPGVAPESSHVQVVHDLGRAVLVNGYALFWSLVLTLLAWLVGLIPLLGAVVAPPLLFLIQAYYSAIGLSDPSLERHRFSVRATISHARTHRAAMLGLGSGFMLILLIPILGWFLAPTYGTVAATLLTHNLTSPAPPKENP